MQQPEPKNTEVSVVDDMLNAVLSLMPVPDVSYVPDFIRYQGISDAVRNFNPDTHVIVTKEQLDITNQLKALTAMAATAEHVKNKIDEVHAVQFGKLYQPVKVKKPTKKQVEHAELMELRKEAHLRMANRPERTSVVKK